MSKITLHLQCMEDEYKGLKEVTEVYKSVIHPNEPPTEDHSQIRIYCEERLCQLQTAHETVTNKLYALQNVYQNIMKIYGESSKTEKKDMLTEIEEFRQKYDFRSLKQETESIVAGINARIREIKTQATILDLSRQQASSAAQAQEVLQPEDDYEETDPCGLLHSNQKPKSSDAQPLLWESQCQEEQFEFSPALRIKYPQIKLPHFSGENDSWEEFWDTYSLIVDQNPQLSELEKILYLKDAIRGKAQMAIKSIPMSSSNYRLIVEVLQKKFGNKANNRSHIVQQLLDVPNATLTAEKCVDTLERVNDLVFQIVATGYDIRKKHDPLWIDTILSKFPYDVIKDCMKMSSGDQKQTVGKLLEELHEQVSSRALFESRYASLTSKRFTTEPTQRTKTFKQQQCLFCQRNNHLTKDCRTVQSPIDRRNALRTNPACWKCFANDHRSRTCTQRNCLRCGGDHHISLCLAQTKESPSVSNVSSKSHDETRKASENSDRKSGTQKVTYRNHSGQMACDTGQPTAPQEQQQKAMNSFSNQTEGNFHENSLVLMTVEGQIKNYTNDSFENVIIFLDSGAQCNLIDAALAQTLALPGSEPYQCTMHGIGGSVQTYTAQQVNAVFRTRFGECLSISLSTKPVLTNSFPAATLTASDVQFLRNNHIFLSNTATNGQLVTPAVLIGVESYEQIVLLDSPPTKLPSGLLAQNTVFGPALFGKSNIPTLRAYTQQVVLACPEVMSDVKRELREMYELDGMGIVSDEYHVDDSAHEYLNNYSKRIRIENGVITAPFPLKDNIVDLESNYNVALSRLSSLHKFHNQHEDQKDWYIKILEDYKQNDIIEEVPTSERHCPDKTVYYMPHAGVWKGEKTTPLRIVFDASSKGVGKLSLNDVMYTGGSFVNKIQNILTYSRWCKILVTADIQAAFTQIRIAPEHRDLLRFLWLRDPDRTPSPTNTVHYRFKRLPFGTKSSPSILNMAIATYLATSDKPLSKEILDNIYVDNVFLAANTDEEAIEKIASSKELFSHIGMNLRDFISNSEYVNASIPVYSKGKSGSTKLLGVPYNTEDDELLLKVTLSPKQHMTKRELVSAVHKLYDPLGLALPLTLKAKLLMREVVMLKTAWGKSLSQEHINRWNEICTEISGVFIKVPRNIGPVATGEEGSTLWIFGDASQLAISCCSYVTHPPDNQTRGLLCAKTRLAPVERQLSIPRLELLAILISLRLARTILQSYQSRIRNVHILSDSKIALAWTQTSRKLPLFVANQVDRIKKLRHLIQEYGTSLTLSYIESEKNPADIATRPVARPSFEASDWITGPQWFKLQQAHWPIDSSWEQTPTSQDKDQEETSSAPLCAPAIQTSKQAANNLIDLSRFRYYSRALSTLAGAMKALVRWIARVNKQNNRNIAPCLLRKFSTHNELTAAEVKTAEHMLIHDQTQNSDINELRSKYRDKNLFYDENRLIRAKSRLVNSALPRDTREPIFIPSDSELVRLIVRELHETNMHCSRQHTLSLLRMRFWVPKPSSKIRKILSECTVCKKEQGLPFPYPATPPLPKDRVVKSKPFEHAGCDYIGPFNTDNDEKAYIALYTCLTTRAVHLEAVDNLSASAFLDSFLRFISRRGVPTLMRSDCGSNFVLGAKVLDLLFQKDQEGRSVMAYSATRNIKWIFNPPAAPWMGGVWERIVGTVKKCLSKTIGRKRLPYTKFTTVLACIEAVVNTRPLTKVDPEDLTSFPLRPVDFLQGNVKFSLPESKDIEEQSDPNYEENSIATMQQAREAIEFAQEMANHFWKRWQKEYLTELRDVHKTLMKQRRHISRALPEVGEIVLIQQDGLVPRSNWPLGRVTDLVTSADGLVRSAKVLTPSGNICHRPVTKLIPLEIRSLVDGSKTAEAPHRNDNKSPIEQRTSLPRKAKQNITYYDTENESEKSSYSQHFKTNGNFLSKLLLYPFILLALIPAVFATHISCQNGTVIVTPPSPSYTLCFNKACQNRTTNQTSTFALPPSAHEEKVKVTLLSRRAGADFSHSRMCDRQAFCADKTLFTTSLLGNPHCWPEGAILTAISLAALIVLLALLLGILIRNKWSQLRPSTSHHQPTPKTQEDKGTPFTLGHLKPSTFVTGALVLLTICTAQINSCQHFHAHYNAELICDDSNKCTVEYEQELFFNKLHQKVCIMLRYHNNTVGNLKLTLQRTRRICNKETLFFTRNTAAKVYYERRCPFMGSCIEDKCRTLQPNDSIPELHEAEKFPGYSMCTSTCTGLTCGCLTPFPADAYPGCLFYRVAQVPQNDEVYHIFKCSSWNPEIHLTLETTHKEIAKNESLQLHPYVSKKVGAWDMKITSVQNMQDSALNKRYAESAAGFKMLGDASKIAVECPDESTASENFSRCSNEVICTCSHTRSRVQCMCPQHSLKDSQNSITTLPIIASHLNITASDTVIIDTDDGEISLLITSKKQIQMSQVVIDPPCTLHATAVTGCYNCLEAAKSTVHCYSEKTTEITLECTDQTFLIKCSKYTLANVVMLQYDHANVKDVCSYQSAGKLSEITLTGTLLYHTPTLDHEIFADGKQTTASNTAWWSNISLPDIGPLAATITKNWKTTVAVITSFTVIGLLTYFLGPTVIIAIVHLLVTVVFAMVQTLFACLTSLFSLLRRYRNH